MERLTYRGTPQMTEDGMITPSYSDYPTRRIIERLADYEDAEDQGLLYRKVWILKEFCHKPKDCDGDCKYCHMNELEVDEEIIKCSDFDETRHYKTKEEAEMTLASMQKGNKSR